MKRRRHHRRPRAPLLHLFIHYQVDVWLHVRWIRPEDHDLGPNGLRLERLTRRLTAGIEQRSPAQKFDVCVTDPTSCCHSYYD